MERKIRMGMIGGGKGAFIGKIHRMAATMDGGIDLVCGAFSSSAEKSAISGKELYLQEDRVYASYEEMITKEAGLPEDQRMDFVSIVTPNHLHFSPALMALEHGFHVVCDKPLCFDLGQAYQLRDKVISTGKLFALTHCYSGYPMVKQARMMIRDGRVGEIRKIIARYPQGWLHTDIENAGQPQASWRTDPQRSGMAGALGDIGTHAAHLVEYISGLHIHSLCADITTFVKGRRLDDDANLLIGLTNGVKGVLTVTQIATGMENDLMIDIYGTKGSLSWNHIRPNSLSFRQAGRPVEIYRSGESYLYPKVLNNCRLPPGHPEGYIEAFANIYKNFAENLRSKLSGKKPDPLCLDYPGIEDGVRGMEFIYKAIESSKLGGEWVSI